MIHFWEFYFFEVVRQNFAGASTLRNDQVGRQMIFVVQSLRKEQLSP